MKSRRLRQDRSLISVHLHAFLLAPASFPDNVRLSHSFVGTPAYTSPEQMEMSALDVDTRADIYSLGVLLYELLAEHPPFDPEALIKSGFDAMRRMIREVDPPRPSSRLNTLCQAERTSVAHARATDAAKLSIVLRGDLDWIAMRCLEKDRTRRYETANSLADDVQRFLADEPITARPPAICTASARLRAVTGLHSLPQRPLRSQLSQAWLCLRCSIGGKARR